MYNNKLPTPFKAQKDLNSVRIRLVGDGNEYLVLLDNMGVVNYSNAEVR